MCYLVTFDRKIIINGECPESGKEPYRNITEAKTRAEKLVATAGVSGVKVWKLFSEPVFKPVVEWKES